MVWAKKQHSCTTSNDTHSYIGPGKTGNNFHHHDSDIQLLNVLEAVFA